MNIQLKPRIMRKFTFFLSALIFLSISGIGSEGVDHCVEFEGGVTAAEFAEIARSFI